jgi:hypothetical protein
MFGRISSVRSLFIIASSHKFLQMNILHLPSYHQKCPPGVSGLEMSLIMSPVGPGKLLPGPVDSGKPFYQKPGGFWQTFVKSRVDSRKLLPGRMDSRKGLQKPSRFSQTPARTYLKKKKQKKREGNTFLF